VVTLGVLFGLHVFPLTGRTLVPIAGMMVGNSMTATVLAGRRLTDELRDKRDEVEARLALGQPARQAATPYVRAALRAALTPQIETTKATGLVFLPGAMTGLILAGTAPLQAVLVQAVVMFQVLAATATTTVVIALGLIRRLFTHDHRLVYLPTPPTTEPPPPGSHGRTLPAAARTRDAGLPGACRPPAALADPFTRMCLAAVAIIRLDAGQPRSTVVLLSPTALGGAAVMAISDIMPQSALAPVLMARQRIDVDGAHRTRRARKPGCFVLLWPRLSPHDGVNSGRSRGCRSRGIASAPTCPLRPSHAAERC
jgi:hypothetical protein